MSTEAYTLIIPTYNRPNLLARGLRFFLSRNVSARFIIADSSEGKCRSANEEMVRSMDGKLDILLLHSHPGEPFIMKVMRALDHVQTDYLVFCADDDIVNPDAIDQSLDFLAGNPEYSICFGYFLAYQMGAFGHSLVSHPDYSCESIEDGSGLERWLKLMSSYSGMWYGVRRTGQTISSFLEIMKCFPAQQSSLGNLMEMIDSANCVISGKIKRLPLMYSYRKGWPPTPSWEILIPHAEFSTHYSAFKGHVCGKLVGNGCYSEKEAGQIFDAAFTNYLRTAIAPVPILEAGSSLDRLYRENEKNRFRQPVGVEEIKGYSMDVFRAIEGFVLELPDEDYAKPQEQGLDEFGFLTVNPDDLSDDRLVEEARKSFLSDQYNKVEDFCRVLLTRSPARHEGWMLLARVACEMKDLDYSQELVEQAMQFAPEESEYQLFKADVLTRKGEHAGALEIFGRLVVDDPGYAPAWLGQAVVYDRIGNSDQAQHSFNQATMHAKNVYDQARGALNYSAFLFRRERIFEAREQVLKVIQLLPNVRATIEFLSAFTNVDFVDSSREEANDLMASLTQLTARKPAGPSPTGGGVV